MLRTTTLGGVFMGSILAALPKQVFLVGLDFGASSSDEDENSRDVEEELAEDELAEDG